MTQKTCSTRVQGTVGPLQIRNPVVTAWKCQGCDGFSHVGSLNTDGGCVIFFRKRAKGQANVQGKEQFQVLSHFVLVLRAQALCPGFVAFVQLNIKRRHQRTELVKHKGEESSWGAGRERLVLSNHVSVSELC